LALSLQETCGLFYLIMHRQSSVTMVWLVNNDANQLDIKVDMNKHNIVVNML